MPRATAARLAQTVLNGRTIVIDTGPHYPNLERPQEFDAQLDRLLASVQVV